MNLLFFDCETNGKPVAYGKSYTDLDNWPRVAQLAWILSDREGKIIDLQQWLIKPDGWAIPKEDFFINNGMTTERNHLYGHPIAPVLEAFLQAKYQADVLVAHNLSFDHPIVWAEIIRSGRQPRSGMLKVCTMKASTKFCNLPGKRGPKWPTLQELHMTLFGKPFDGAHDAAADITATKDCFFELVRRGVIPMPAPTEAASR